MGHVRCGECVLSMKLRCHRQWCHVRVPLGYVSWGGPSNQRVACKRMGACGCSARWPLERATIFWSQFQNFQESFALPCKVLRKMGPRCPLELSRHRSRALGQRRSSRYDETGRHVDVWDPNGRLKFCTSWKTSKFVPRHIEGIFRGREDAPSSMVATRRPETSE